MSEKHKKVCTTLNYTEYFLISCVPISAFHSLFGISIANTSSAIGLKVCAIAAEITSISQSIRKRKKA